MEKQRSIMTEQGFSMTEGLIAIGLFSILNAAVLSFMLSVRSEIQGEKARTAVYAARNLVLGTLKAPAAWQKTVAMQNTTNFLCYEKPQSQCANTDQQGYATFALYEAAGQTLVGPANVKPGFTYQGIPCQGADPVQGSDACPIGVQLKWKRICATHACENPVAQVVADFFHRPKGASRAAHLNTKALAIHREIPKFAAAMISATRLINHSRSLPKLYGNRTCYSRRHQDKESSYISRKWQNSCWIYTYERSLKVDLPSASTLIASASNWVLIWGAKGLSYWPLLPKDHDIRSPTELELYFDKDTRPCASDSGDGLGIHRNFKYDHPGGTAGADQTVTCTRFFAAPQQVQVRLVARVTSCVSNSAIDPDPDFRVIELTSTLIR